MRGGEGSERSEGRKVRGGEGSERSEGRGGQEREGRGGERKDIMRGLNPDPKNTLPIVYTTPHHTAPPFTIHILQSHHTFLHRTLCQKPCPQHDGGVAGVGAAGDGRDDDVTMCQ